MLLLLLLLAGVILVLANELVNARRTPRVEYKYLPRDLDTYLREEPYASATYERMFAEPDLRLGR